MKIQAGKMRSTITVQQPGTPGSLGQTTWVTFATVRAELQSSTGKELFSPGLPGSEASHVFVTRYLSGVSAKMRVLFGARVFKVTYTQTADEGNNRLTQIFCREVTV